MADTEPTALQLKPSRSWARVFDDIRQGLAARELWAHLGWQDIKQRYRRSVLGPLWITISQGVIALGLGLLYGLLFGSPYQTFLPYVTTGLVIWTFISNSLVEGMETFISNEGLIKHLPAPLSVYALRTVWRQTLMLGHNILVYVIVFGIFFTSIDNPYSLQTKSGLCEPDKMCHPGLSWHYVLVVPGFLLVAINAAWVSLFLGIISTRFRDLPQLVGALQQLLFYLTPIVWPVDALFNGEGPRGDLSFISPVLNLNPFYHLVQVVRGPLTGGGVDMWNWIGVGLMAVVGWTCALVFMRNYRARVAYWV